MILDFLKTLIVFQPVTSKTEEPTVMQEETITDTVEPLEIGKIWRVEKMQ